jgi:hypothetical protein
METKALGNSDLRITPVGFGAWAIGGDWEFGWGAQDDGQSVAAIHGLLRKFSPALASGLLTGATRERIAALPKTDCRTRNRVAGDYLPLRCRQRSESNPPRPRRLPRAVPKFQTDPPLRKVKLHLKPTAVAAERFYSPREVRTFYVFLGTTSRRL